MGPSVFVTAQDFIEAYGVDHAIIVTNLNNPTATQIDYNVLNLRVAEANATILAYVARQNLQSVPLLLKTIGVRLVNRFLHTYEVPEATIAEGNWAMAMLRDIASGRIRLEDSQGEAPSQGSPQLFQATLDGHLAAYDSFRLW